MTKFALAIFLKGIDNMPFMNKLYELQQPIRTMTTPPGCLRQPTSPYTGEAISWERLALKPLPCTGEAVKLGAACVETAPLLKEPIKTKVAVSAPLCKGSWQSAALTEGLLMYFFAFMCFSALQQPLRVACGNPPPLTQGRQ